MIQQRRTAVWSCIGKSYVRLLRIGSNCGAETCFDSATRPAHVRASQDPPAIEAAKP